MLAAEGGHTETAVALIEAGAVVDHRSWVSFYSAVAMYILARTF